MGLPNITPIDELKVLVDNKLTRATVSLMMLCVSLDIPVAVENPHSSRLWHAPPMEHLRSRNIVREFVADFCQSGQPWRKRTRFISYGVDLSRVARMCSSKKGICSRTGKPHIPLCGVRAGVFMTHVAEPYPATLSNALALCFHDALAARAVNTLSRYV
eukprot:9491131-Heterocapsa_arctica.AAC.1